MTRLKKILLLIICTLAGITITLAQDTTKSTEPLKPLFNDSAKSIQIKTDSTKVISSEKKSLRDSTPVKPKHDPRKATLRSAIIPGWGQIYNREYWKLPLVYGALAIPASLYVYNNNYYKMTKFAYQAVYAATIQTPLDRTLLLKIDPRVMPKGTFTPLDITTYQTARNSYKRDKDYSLLWFFIVWGLNVADATVFGHLKDFDVSDDLGMQLKPTFSPETKSSGMGLVFNLDKRPHKLLPVPER